MQVRSAGRWAIEPAGSSIRRSPLIRSTSSCSSHPSQPTAEVPRPPRHRDGQRLERADEGRRCGRTASAARRPSPVSSRAESKCLAARSLRRSRPPNCRRAQGHHGRRQAWVDPGASGAPDARSLSRSPATLPSWSARAAARTPRAGPGCPAGHHRRSMTLVTRITQRAPGRPTRGGQRGLGGPHVGGAPGPDSRVDGGVDVGVDQDVHIGETKPCQRRVAHVGQAPRSRPRHHPGARRWR